MKTHISKELALWLRERGCRLPTDKAYYGNAGTWHNALVDLDGYASADPEFREAKLLLAYSWYDILVIHAKEFWGEADYFCAECREQIYDEDGCQNMKCQTENHEIVAHLFYPEYLLELLQNGLVEEAEACVRQHSVFA